MTYNLVLVSGVQQSDPALYIHTHVYICSFVYINVCIVLMCVHRYIFFCRFFPLIDYYYKILSIVPCAIQEVLVGHLFCIQ